MCQHGAARSVHLCRIGPSPRLIVGVRVWKCNKYFTNTKTFSLWSPVQRKRHEEGVCTSFHNQRQVQGCQPRRHSGFGSCTVASVCVLTTQRFGVGRWIRKPSRVPSIARFEMLSFCRLCKTPFLFGASPEGEFVSKARTVRLEVSFFHQVLQLQSTKISGPVRILYLTYLLEQFLLARHKWDPILFTHKKGIDLGVHGWYQNLCLDSCEHKAAANWECKTVSVSSKMISLRCLWACHALLEPMKHPGNECACFACIATSDKTHDFFRCSTEANTAEKMSRFTVRLSGKHVLRCLEKLWTLKMLSSVKTKWLPLQKAMTSPFHKCAVWNANTRQTRLLKKN